MQRYNRENKERIEIDMDKIFDFGNRAGSERAIRDTWTELRNSLAQEKFIYSETDKALMVFRPYQVFATENLIRKALDTSKGGFIFHLPSSCKSLSERSK